MAKGRKLTTSRSERLLGSYSYGHGGQGSNGTDTSSELGEEDVWSMVDNMADREDHVIVNNNSNNSTSSQGEYSSRASGESNGTMSIRSRRRILRDDHNVGGLSLAFDDSGMTTATTTATTMTTTTTASSRILHQFRGGNNNESVGGSPRGGHHMATSAPVNVPDWSKILRVDSVESLQGLDDGMEDGDSEMVPPHEYLARECARRQKIAATSVFEGMGRTLKGRDMRRVRDAVWSQTGFDG